MSSILTNNGAMVALQTMKSVNKNLGTIQDTLSTGKKISTAKDNAAVWSIASTMSSDVSSFKAIGDSLALGQSAVSVAGNAATQVKDLLETMKQKIVTSNQEGINTETIQTDIDSLRNQIKSVVGSAQFNGMNLLSGTEDVKILGSLDRAADGTVSASQISISRRDLTTKSSEMGTTGRAETVDGAVSNDSLDVTDKLDVKKGVTVTFSDISTAPADGSSVVMTVGGQDFTLTFQNTVAGSDSATQRYLDADTGLTLQAISDAFSDMIGAAAADGGLLQGQGITITAGTNAFDIETQRKDALTISIKEGAGGDTDVSVAIAGIESATADLVSGTDVTATALTTTAVTESIKATTSTLTLNAGTVAEGDSYRISLDGKNYDYVAKKDEDLNDVAKGLKTLVDAQGIKGLTLTVNKSDAPNTSDVTIDFNFTDSDTSTDLDLVVSNFTGGKAGGGLENLDKIDVSKDGGPAAALTYIDGLIETATKAASSFGSDSNRLETQQDFVSKLTDSLKSGIGTLVDANMEETAARLQALQVQQQLATQALSIANQAPQNILALFR